MSRALSRREGLDALSLACGGALPESSPDPIADERALGNYRRRARELQRMIDGDDLDPVVAEGYRRELATLEAFLRTSVGLGGRARAFTDNNERARTAVRKALVRAVNVIASVEPGLGDHLRASVVTGVTCRYSPTPGWKLTVQRDVR